MSDKQKTLAEQHKGLKFTRPFDYSFEHFMAQFPDPSFTSADFGKLVTEGSFATSGPMPPLLSGIGNALADDTRYFTIGDVQMLVRVKDYSSDGNEAKLQLEILDVLSPPAAREAWLKEQPK